MKASCVFARHDSARLRRDIARFRIFWETDLNAKAQRCRDARLREWASLYHHDPKKGWGCVVFPVASMHAFPSVVIPIGVNSCSFVVTIPNLNKTERF